MAVARSPLILSVVAAVCREAGARGEEVGSVVPTISGLYDCYLATMLCRKRTGKKGAAHEPSAGLRRLAANMTAQKRWSMAFCD